jgi:hypothetical protein
MSNTVQIKIMDVEVGKATTKTQKPYEFLEVSYKNQSFQDKPEVKKVMPFGSKEVYDALKGAVKGDVFTVTREKNDNGFWDWISIQQGVTTDMSAREPQKAVATAPVKSTWETPEERATKQLYIIRQFCLAQAVNTLTVPVKPGTEVSPNDVLKLAEIYINFVCGTGAKQTDDIGEDIPY